MVFRALLSLGWWQEVRQVPYIKGKKELVLVGCDKKKSFHSLSVNLWTGSTLVENSTDFSQKI